MSLIKGIITPMITPVRNDDINVDDLDSLLTFLKNIGVKGIFPMGSTGLFAFFSFDKHKKMLEATIKRKPSGIAAYAGVSRNNFEETMSMIKTSKDLGYDAVVVVVPYYFKISQETILSYLNMVSKIDMPVIIYNIPQFTGNAIMPETLSKLIKENDNVKGLKDSSGDLRTFQMFINELPNDFYVYQGQDDLLLPSVSIGAAGGVCGTSNFSDKIVKVYDKRSVKVHREIVKIMKNLALYEFPKPYYYLFRKIVLKEANPKNYMPFPLNDLEESQEKALDEVLQI
jgi:Dihydrodipicolinate synthase/N-acetylneuraminate lyase